MSQQQTQQQTATQQQLLPKTLPKQASEGHSQSQQQKPTEPISMQSIQQKIEGMLRFGKEELAALEGMEGLEGVGEMDGLEADWEGLLDNIIEGNQSALEECDLLEKELESMRQAMGLQDQ